MRRALEPTLDIREKKRLLALVIDCVFLRSGRGRSAPVDDFVHVCAKGTGPDDLPDGRSAPGSTLRPFRFPDSALMQNPA